MLKSVLPLFCVASKHLKIHHVKTEEIRIQY